MITVLLAFGEYTTFANLLFLSISIFRAFSSLSYLNIFHVKNCVGIWSRFVLKKKCHNFISKTMKFCVVNVFDKKVSSNIINIHIFKHIHFYSVINTNIYYF